MNVKTDCFRGRSFRRRAFTLVELLVVVAIIGVLVAILLPAVQLVRESARRAACTNNARQLALGVLNFENVHKGFPNNGGDELGGGDYIVPIMPFIEESKRFNDWKAGTSSALTAGVISMLRCPSNFTVTRDKKWNGSTTIDMQNNYLAVIGDKWVYSNTDGGGVIVYKSGSRRIEKSNVEDGLSKTAMIGEYAHPDWATKEHLVGATSNNPGSTLTRKTCRDYPKPTTASRIYLHGSRFDFRDSSCATAWPPNDIHCGRWWGSGPETNAAISSWHPGGVMVGMADASVKFINDDIDAGDRDNVKPGADTNRSTNNKGVWGALGTRAGAAQDAVN